jgi:hypothetical protein
MAFTDSADRTTPSNWIIQTNDGTTVVAINTVTKETYNGTLSGFNNLLKQARPTFDVADASPVVLVDPATGAPYAASGGDADHEFVVTTYTVKTAFTGASVGNTITATQVIDVSGVTPSTVTTIWRNQTTATDLASVPSATNLELVGSTALTDAQLRATAVPVSAASLPLPSGAATSANQTTSNTSLSSIDNKIPTATITGLLPVDTLAAVGVARQLAAGAATANTALTTTCRRISIHARNADIRYAIGTVAQTASATSHFIGQSERLDIDVAANTQIAVIRAGTTDGVLELSELLIA